MIDIDHSYYKSLNFVLVLKTPNSQVIYIAIYSLSLSLFSLQKRPARSLDQSVQSDHSAVHMTVPSLMVAFSTTTVIPDLM